MTTYSELVKVLRNGTIRCGNCNDRHATVHMVRECYELTREMEELVAESQMAYLNEW